MSIPGVPRITRRTSLVAVGGSVLWVASGCTDSPIADSSAQPSSTTPGESKDSAVAEADSDEPIVDAARSELLNASDLIRRTLATHGALSSALTPLLELHLAHDAVLVDSSPESVAAPGPVVPSTRAAALRVVRRTEARLPGELANLAQRSASGALARILASMSAATTQQLSIGLVNPSEPG